MIVRVAVAAAVLVALAGCTPQPEFTEAAMRDAAIASDPRFADDEVWGITKEMGQTYCETAANFDGPSAAQLMADVWLDGGLDVNTVGVALSVGHELYCPEYPFSEEE